MKDIIGGAECKKRIAEAIESTPYDNQSFVCLDIDAFKIYNEKCGYEAGNRLLNAISSFSCCPVRGSDRQVKPIHLYADFFAFLVPEAPGSIGAFFDSLEQLFKEKSEGFCPIFHLGVIKSFNRNDDPSSLADKALIALSSVKGGRVDRIAFYDPAMQKKAIEEQELSQEMPEALATGQFTIYLQPQVNYDLRHLILTGGEALVRWDHPERGLVLPSSFIPLFERNGLVKGLDAFVWEKTCSCLAKWSNDSGALRGLPLSVNVSRCDLADADLCDRLKDMCERHHLPLSALRLEITESAYSPKSSSFEKVVERLHSYGFYVEMDDFGSGYSSLSALRDIPVDAIKLDMRFASRGLEEGDERGKTIIKSIVDMAKTLGTDVIAEGVETKEQAESLFRLSCNRMQGYHFARPMPEDDFVDFARCMASQ